MYISSNYEVLTFDQRGRLISDALYQQDGSLLRSEQIEFRGNNVEKYTLTDSWRNTLVVKYDYSRNRLISESSSFNNRSFVGDIEYKYDSRGRLILRESKREVDIEYPDYSYFVPYYLWLYQIISYEYDDVGNLILEPRIATPTVGVNLPYLNVRYSYLYEGVKPQIKLYNSVDSNV